MASIDAEWNEVGPTSAETESGCKILWQCHIMDQNDTGIWADNEPDEHHRIEVAHISNTRTVTLGELPETWTIDIEQMAQTNDKNGTRRSVRRTVVVAT